MNPATAAGKGTLRRALGALLLGASLLLAGGCATAPAGGSTASSGDSARPAVATHPSDPWEAWNRKVFAFNDALDEALLIPVATAYRDGVPQFMRTGIGNFFGNLRDVWSTANHFLQGKPASGFEMGMRVLTNTFFGLGGLLDPASEAGLTRRSEDLGQTLAVWGAGSGPYLVLPLFGPSTVRDTFGLIGDRQVGLTASDLFNRSAERYSATALEVVHTRAGLLGTTGLLGQVALDRYTLTRGAYLARRLDQIHDGNPPMEFSDGDAFEDWDDEDEDGDPPAGQPSNGSDGAAPQPGG